MRVTFRVAALLAVLAGCSSPPTAPSPLDARLSVAYGQTASLGDPRITVRFDSVVEDSRCPADAMCVWEGRAVVRLVVSEEGKDTRVDLGSSPASARLATAGSVSVEWVQLEPYPYAGQPADPGAYKVTVHITR